MSSCERFETAIWEAAETGSMPGDLAEHVRNCKQCAHTLAELQSAMDGFAALTAVDAPDPTRAVHARLESRPSLWRRTPVFAGALAAVILICYALSLIGTPHAPPENVVSAPRHAPTVDSRKPRLSARRPEARREHPRSIVRLHLPRNYYPDHRPRVALSPPARPESHENSGAVVDKQQPDRQSSYVIVFTSRAEPCSIEVESRNVRTGEVTVCRGVVDEDGNEIIIQAIVTRNDANTTEEPGI